MALLTPLSLDAARALTSSYGIDLAELEPLAAGSVNSNFGARDASGARFFLRLYEEQDAAGAQREVELLRALAASGVPVAAALPRRDGGYVAEHDGKPFAVFGWVEGEIVCQRSVRPEHCTRIGAALARVHQTAVTGLPAGRFTVGDLERRLEIIEANAAPELVTAARAIREQLRSYAARRVSLPSGLIHGDLFKDNVLWRGGELCALLDFESASHGAFAYDLMVTVMAWCYSDRFVPELASALFGGYQSVRPLSAAELEALPVEGAIGALRFATTRITDFSMRTPAGATPKRDYRRFLQRLAAIEQGALHSSITA